ncbi:uncharacterized protein V1516DRAFT_673335 [Lipomyces oligophaga]|uniref:uncharacterized protein n=1 Tax=Lipomyces oligophaga TaxID=45792 RepID=UPI0034CF0EB5
MSLLNDDSVPFPLTEENLQTLLRAINDSSPSDTRPMASSAVVQSTTPTLPRISSRYSNEDIFYRSPVPSSSHSRRFISSPLVLGRETDDSDTVSVSVSDVTSDSDSDGRGRGRQISRVPRTASTVASTPQGSVANFAARQAAALLGSAGRRPVQGLRHRRRLENARMLNNPHAVPPSAQDLLPTPTYSIRRIDDVDLQSYLSHTAITDSFLASIDQTLESRRQQRKQNIDRPHISRTLKDRVKRGHLTQPYLKSIEQDVREFIISISESSPSARQLESHVDHDAILSAALARQGLSSRSPSPSNLTRPTPPSAQYLLEKIIEIAPDSDKAERFSRWIVYQIAEYYKVSCYTKIIDNRQLPCVVLNVDGSHDFSEIPTPIWTVV